MLAGLGKILTKDAVKAALPGAGINALVGLVAGGPGEALKYGLGDLLVNAPAIGVARKYFRGKDLELKDPATGKIVKEYRPSGVETGVNLVASLASMPLTDAILGPGTPQVNAQQFLAQQAQQVNPALQPQAQQTAQQLAQRSYINRLPLNQMQLSPNTMYQTQGVEQTAFHYPGLTLPPELRAELKEYITAQ